MSDQTQVKEKTEQQTEQTRTRQEISIAGPRLPYHPAFQERFGIDQSAWRALVESIYPSAKTVEGVLLAMSYCKARNIDIFKRPVHVVPIWSSSAGREVESVWPGINELRTTACRTGQYAGCDPTLFGEERTFHFEGRIKDGKDWREAMCDVLAPSWAQVTVYRLVGGQRWAFPGPRIMYSASYGKRGKAEYPNDKWERSPSYMLEKVAEAAALRKAFPEEIGDQHSAEEMEGQAIDMGGTGEIIDQPPARPTREPNPRAAAESARKTAADHDAAYRATMAEEAPTEPQDERAEAQQPSTGEPTPAAETPPAAQAQAQPATHPSQHHAVDNLLRKKIGLALTKTSLDAALADYAEELDAMRTEDEDRWKLLMRTVNEKRGTFKK